MTTNNNMKEQKNEAMKKYVAPTMEKHEPVKVVQGSGGCSGYYYTALYSTYYYYYY